MTKIIPVILCGGAGTRLWPLSRESFPEQFATLVDGRSLFSLTIDLVKQLGSPIFVTNEEHRFFVQDLLSREPNFSGSGIASILLEPAGRNTAAAMGGAAFFSSMAPSDLLLFLPADHFVPDVGAFCSKVFSY